MSRLAAGAGILLCAAALFGAGLLVAPRSNPTAPAPAAVPAPSNPADIARAILLPSVQVSAGGGPGSGTIIHSDPERGTWVLSAFHVVERAAQKNSRPIQVTVYSGDAEERFDGDLAAWDEKKDLALVRLRTSRLFPTARLAPRERLAAVGLFTPVYAVGCALGHDPLPSAGEISALRKDVQGERFWMMSAPTIFGNSGGGVFHRETLDLVGVSTMVCTFDNSPTRTGGRPSSVPVPHLGILMPLESVTAWLDSRGYRFLHAAP